MAKKITRMISLDTSTVKTGFAYWENGKLISTDIIDKSKEKDKDIRFEDMCISIIDLLNRYKPHIVCIETTVVSRNVQAQRKLSEILGVVFGWTLCNAAEFVSIRPTEWRSLVTDSGESIPKKREDLKLWSQLKVKQIFDIVVSDDEADAILLGLARINQMNMIA